ncbi:MAG: serine--tRNA ligase [Myxococcota bacterium]|nr:serine--tRNA ligase [Myxococcota bacterium]
MLERNRLISDPESVRKNLKMRRAGEEMFTDLERLIECINTRRAVQKETDQLRANRKSLSKKIGQLMKSGQRDEAEQIKQQVRDQAEKLQQLDHRRKELESEEYDLLLSLPNLLDPTVPEGDSDEHNELVRSWGEPIHPDFPVLEHHNLLHKIQLLDSERAAKVAGTRFSILRGPIAKLERSLINFFLDEAENNGYLEVMVPYIVNSSSMIGTSQLPKFEKDLFKLTTQVAGEDAYLIPTAEVPVTNIHRGEILDEEALPLHYTAFTPCFRSEAGSYGKDTHGLIRQHQFHKVELVKICTPENSPAEHEALTNHAAQLLEKLGLPYRIMRLCSGDISFGARLCYDLEVWLPGQKQYREISSCSNFGDFQARRMMLRYRPKAGGKPQFCHTINGSGLAIGRSLVAIVENYQQPDGSILIPDCLQDYMKQKKIEIS